jgi:hypothetical protein
MDVDARDLGVERPIREGEAIVVHRARAADDLCIVAKKPHDERTGAMKAQELASRGVAKRRSFLGHEMAQLAKAVGAQRCEGAEIEDVGSA